MSRFSFSRRMRESPGLSLAIGLAAIGWTLAVLGVVAIASISPAKAQDLPFQQAALETEEALEAGPALNLDLSFLIREKDVWQIDAADFSSEREGDIESCCVAAEATYQTGALNGGFDSDDMA